MAGGVYADQLGTVQKPSRLGTLIIPTQPLAFLVHPRKWRCEGEKNSEKNGQKTDKNGNNSWDSWNL
jgi:hypothetical protein